MKALLRLFARTDDRGRRRSRAHAQARVFSQAELDALLAPIALYPDPLLNQVLDASLFPDEVARRRPTGRAPIRS